MNLRQITTLLLALTFLTLPSLAREADMQKVAERYIKSLLKEVPELAGTKKTRAAREEILAEYKRKEILQLSAALRKTIESRKNPVPEAAYNKALSQLKDATNQTKEVKFIIQNASEEDVDGELRLLLFRLMERSIDDDQDIRKNTLTQLLEISRAYRNQHDKYAPTLADLSLYPEIAKFTDKTGKKHDWLYLGGPKKGITRKSYRLIFVEPVADSTGNALAINSRGSKIPVVLTSLKKEIEELAKELEEKSKPKTTSKPKKTLTPEKQTTSTKSPHETTDYSSILKHQMKDIMISYLAYAVKNKKYPSSLADLNLPNNLLKSTSPDNQSTKDWIFIPPNKTINSVDSKIIFASPYKHNGEHYYIATDSGNIESILPADHSAILDNLGIKQ